MKQCVTIIFLKIVTVLIRITLLIFGVFLLPKFANAMSVLVPMAASFKLPFPVCVYATMVIFSFALYQAVKLLHYIDNGKVLSGASIKTLKSMKIAGTLMTALLYLAGMPVIYLVAQMGDTPGLIVIGFGIAPMLFIVTTLVVILQRLLQEATIIEFESDFMVRGEHIAMIINIDVMLTKRRVSVTELAERVGITLANLSVLKNGKTEAIRFSTLEGVCKALDCQFGDILEYQNSEASQTGTE